MLLDVRTEILTLLEGLKGNPFKAVESYSGQLNEGSDFAKRLPACLLQLEEMTLDEYSSDGSQEGISKYHAFIFSETKRNKVNNILAAEGMVETTIAKLKTNYKIISTNIRVVYDDEGLIVYDISFNYKHEDLI